MKILFGIFMIGIVVINILGYVLLDQHLKVINAGQQQIAGFLMVPESKMTGPIRIFYDVGKDIPMKFRQIKLKPKKRQ